MGGSTPQRLLGGAQVIGAALTGYFGGNAGMGAAVPLAISGAKNLAGSKHGTGRGNLGKGFLKDIVGMGMGAAAGYGGGQLGGLMGGGSSGSAAGGITGNEVMSQGLGTTPAFEQAMGGSGGAQALGGGGGISGLFGGQGIGGKIDMASMAKMAGPLSNMLGSSGGGAPPQQAPPPAAPPHQQPQPLASHVSALDEILKGGNKVDPATMAMMLKQAGLM